VSAWDLSCPDWEQRLRQGRSLLPDLPLDPEGTRAVKIFDKLRLADVPGTPTMADACGDWFRDIVRVLFGALDPVTRARMVRELFLLVPKKNSKTTNGALLMLTALLMNQRPMAPFIMTAPVHDVAEKAYEAAAGAIELDEVLKAKLYTRDHLKEITHRETKAKLEILTFDPVVLTGQKVVGALIDELHVVAKMGKAASALRQIRGGMIPFPEGFLAFITTQSEEQPTGVFADELTKAREIRDGKRQGAMLPVLYEFPESIQRDDGKKSDDGKPAWRDPKLWAMVTPNAGRSITIERLQEDMQVAADTSEAELRAWASQHLNIEIGVALKSGAWIGANYWEANGERALSLKNLLERCEVVTAGVDGGGQDDLLGFNATGRESDTGRWLTWSKAWAHQCVLERRKSEAARLLGFAEDGDLVIIPDDSDQDIRDVADIVEEIEVSGLLDRIGVDPSGIGAIVDAIEAKKIDHERIVGIPQGWKMVAAIKTAERKLAARMLRHGGTRLMAWCLGNAKVVPAGNAVLITKQVSGTAKIDPLMAMFNSVALMSMNPKPRKKKYQLFFA
jgi:phage terminase large subunit-like protein